jgi:hypothetical protein
MNLKEKLLSLNVLVDNEYLDKYVHLIESNYFTAKEKFKTQSHHIIPKCYFTHNGMEVDNTIHNRVNLLFIDHIRAHCYLVLASDENIFKYHNQCAIEKLLAHRDFKGVYDDLKSLEEVQMAYESSRTLRYLNNPMFDPIHKESHDNICRSEEVRSRISNTLKEYRKNNPFTEEHRKKLSQRAVGNHNFGTGDTRSIGCYCIDSNTNETHHFHSYKDAGIWWYNTYNPFNSIYAECTMQRKIKESIEKGFCQYGRGTHKITIENVKWYKEE